MWDRHTCLLANSPLFFFSATFFRSRAPPWFVPNSPFNYPVSILQLPSLVLISIIVIINLHPTSPCLQVLACLCTHESDLGGFVRVGKGGGFLTITKIDAMTSVCLFASLGFRVKKILSFWVHLPYSYGIWMPDAVHKYLPYWYL
jgi:hypothetical protein